MTNLMIVSNMIIWQLFELTYIKYPLPNNPSPHLSTQMLPEIYESNSQFHH